MSMTSNIVGIVVPIVVSVLVAIPACMPNARTAIKAKLSNMDTEIGMTYSIEILEAKKQEMRKSLAELIKTASKLEMEHNKQVANFNKLETNLKELKADPNAVPQDIKVTETKLAMASRLCKTYGAAIAKVTALKDKAIVNIKSHDRNIDLVKSKKLYMESLKTINGYIGSFEDSSGISFNQVNEKIDEDIKEQEALMKSMEEFNKIDLGE